MNDNNPNEDFGALFDDNGDFMSSGFINDFFHQEFGGGDNAAVVDPEVMVNAAEIDFKNSNMVARQHADMYAGRSADFEKWFKKTNESLESNRLENKDVKDYDSVRQADKIHGEYKGRVAEQGAAFSQMLADKYGMQKKMIDSGRGPNGKQLSRAEQNQLKYRTANNMNSDIAAGMTKIFSASEGINAQLGALTVNARQQAEQDQLKRTQMNTVLDMQKVQLNLQGRAYGEHLAKNSIYSPSSFVSILAALNSYGTQMAAFKESYRNNHTYSGSLDEAMKWQEGFDA